MTGWVFDVYLRFNSNIISLSLKADTEQGAEHHRMNAYLQGLIAHIPPLDKGQRFILGIDGLSRSGKSTLTRALEEQMHKKNIPCFTIHIDDHIVERKHRYNTGQQEWREYYFLQWDIVGLAENLFHLVKTETQLTLPFYHEKLDLQIMREVRIPDKCVIVIEGVFLQRKDWRSFFDFVVYLECDRELRLSREAEETKINIDKFSNRYWPAEDHYLAEEQPLRKADLIFKIG